MQAGPLGNPGLSVMHMLISIGCIIALTSLGGIMLTRLTDAKHTRSLVISELVRIYPDPSGIPLSVMQIKKNDLGSYTEI